MSRNHSPRQYRERQLLEEARKLLTAAELELAAYRTRPLVERPLMIESINLRLELALRLLTRVTATVETRDIEKRLGVLRERLDATVAPECEQLARALLGVSEPRLRLVKGDVN